MTTKGKIFVIAGALVVSAAVVGGVLYRAFPVQISTMAGLTRNYFLTLNLPAGAVTTEANAAYSAPVGAEQRGSRTCPTPDDRHAELAAP
jgi:hypothetical protein